MMSKNCQFHSLTYKEASNVFISVQRNGSSRNEVIYHAEAHWLSKGNVSEWCFNCGKSCEFSLLKQGHPMSTNSQDNFGLYLNLSSLLWIVQLFTDKEFDLSYTHVATTTQ